MRFVELQVVNFKRLSRVRVKPTGPVTQVTGRNGAGKTSVLDAIAAALGGAAQSPEVPIRKGELKGEVVLDLDEIRITRKWTQKSSTLEVATKDGAVYKSPQAVLDKFVGPLCFDPLDFTRQKPLDQANTLARIAGIDLDEHRQKRATLYADRATANKTAKELRVQVGGMPPLGDDVPDQEVSLTAILDEVTAAERARRDYQTAERQVNEANTGLTINRQRVEDLRQQLEAAERALVASEARVREAKETLAVLPLPPEVEPIKARGRAAEETNRKVRAKQARATKEKDAAGLEAVAKEITDKIEQLDADLAAKLAGAALPVPGLSLGESGVTVNGIPFGQCSGAERLRVSVAIGLALNPKLKLMLIRDGSLLDSDGMKLLTELAEAANAQVLIERVSDGDGVGVRIVDGSTEEESVAAAKAA